MSKEILEQQKKKQENQQMIIMRGYNHILTVQRNLEKLIKPVSTVTGLVMF